MFFIGKYLSGIATIMEISFLVSFITYWIAFIIYAIFSTEYRNDNNFPIIGWCILISIFVLGIVIIILSLNECEKMRIGCSIIIIILELSAAIIGFVAAAQLKQMATSSNLGIAAGLLSIITVLSFCLCIITWQLIELPH